MPGMQQLLLGGAGGRPAGCAPWPVSALHRGVLSPECVGLDAPGRQKASLNARLGTLQCWCAPQPVQAMRGSRRHAPLNRES